MKRISKIVLIIVMSLMSVSILYLSVGSPDIDINSIAAEYNNLSTKQAFYQYSKEDWIDYIEYVRKETEDVEDKVPKTPIDISNHQHVAFRQSQDKYEKVYIDGNSYTMKKGGCGFISLSTAMVQLNPKDCGGMAPENWVDLFNNTNHKEVFNWWAPGSGMIYGAEKAWIKAVNDIGSYGQYWIQEESTSCNTQAALDAIKEYAGKEEYVVLLSMSDGLFTNSGHIILCTDLYEENGKIYFHISDSSGVAAGHVGKNWEDMCKFNFPLDASQTYDGESYNIKAYWVIGRKE